VRTYERTSRVACALQAFTGYRASVGVPWPGSGATLGDACAQMGIRRSGGHRALDDARATLALLRAMAGERIDGVEAVVHPG